MTKGTTYETMKAAEAKAAAKAAHKAAVAEGRVCACEGPHHPLRCLAAR